MHVCVCVCVLHARSNMADADFSTWTDPDDIADKILEWASAPHVRALATCTDLVHTEIINQPTNQPNKQTNK